MCSAIICLFLSLGARASAEATQCSPTDSTSTCHVSDQSVLLQSRVKISGKTCNPGPCKIRGEKPKGNLWLDIFTPAASQANAGKAVVLVVHGNYQNLEDMHYVCQDLVVPAGFVCASIDNAQYTESSKTLGGEYVEGAIQFLTDHADTYGVDSNSFFAYGYSKGGYSTLEFVEMESDVGNRLKGVVSDNSSPPLKEVFDKMDRRIPPYLSIHCKFDPKMKWDKTVKKTGGIVKDANQDRKKAEREMILWQSMTFYTKCKHASLIMKDKVAKNAMRSFIQNVLDNDPPFTNIPEEVGDKNAEPKDGGKKRRRRKKQTN